MFVGTENFGGHRRLPREDDDADEVDQRSRCPFRRPDAFVGFDDLGHNPMANHVSGTKMHE